MSLIEGGPYFGLANYGAPRLLQGCRLVSHVLESWHRASPRFALGNFKLDRSSQKPEARDTVQDSVEGEIELATILLIHALLLHCKFERWKASLDVRDFLRFE